MTVQSQPTLYMMLGLPGAGKTYFARQFSDQARYVHINENRVRYELFADPQFTTDENEVVDRIMTMLLENALVTRRSIIYDARLLSRASRKRLVNTAKANKYQHLIVWVQTDLNTSQTRAANRDRRRPDDRYSASIDRAKFNSIKKELQKPIRENYVVISGKHDFKTQIATVLRKSRGNVVNQARIVTQSIGGRLEQPRRRTTRR